MSKHYENRRRTGNCTCSVEEGAGTSDHWESCPECRVLVEDNSLALPHEIEICEIGAYLRDSGERISNAQVGNILTHFVTIRNRPEISQAAKRAIQCFHGCTLTSADANAIVKELGYVTHGWERVYLRG